MGTDTEDRDIDPTAAAGISPRRAAAGHYVARVHRPWPLGPGSVGARARRARRAPLAPPPPDSGDHVTMMGL
jgi:hypothetical protein